jgi:hypothetical protein
MWKKVGKLKPSNIVEYTTKQGYILGLLNRRTTMPLDVHLAKRGFTPKQRKYLFARIWHPWLFRKVTTMI